MRKIIIVAGFPGTGKSTLAKKIQKHSGYVLLDKDYLNKGITDRIHDAIGIPRDDRESKAHKDLVRPISHEILYNSAEAVLNCDIGVIIDAPFEQYIQERDWYPMLVERFGVKPLVVWVEVSKELEYSQLKERGRSIDKWKLEHFEEYYAQREGMVIRVPEDDLVRINAREVDVECFIDSICR